jgi:outer membrane biogenesis lipoprotein LolB
MSEYKYELDTQSKVVQAKRDGQRDGQRNKALEIAMNLKGSGIPVQQIALWTGLSVDEITKL